MYVKTLKMPVDGLYLEADLSLPVKAESIIIFSGVTSRFDPLENSMARHLNHAGFGTLLFNLMTREETENMAHHPAIDLVTKRLLAFTLWIKSHSEYHNFEIGYFGFNTGAAATLRASAELGSVIKAMVTVSARTDLAPECLSEVVTPTLFIVGELDFGIVESNRKALKKIRADRQLLVLPGASHLLEEPGKIKTAARDATAWYARYLKHQELFHAS